MRALFPRPAVFRPAVFRLAVIPASLLGLAALGLSAPPAWADTLTTVDFPGAASTKAVGVNDAGNVVGLSVDTSGNTRGFERLAGGTYSAAIVAPNDNQGYTRALGINNAGTIVGDYLNLDNNGVQGYGGYLLKGTAYTTFGVGGPVSTGIAAINAAGDFAGSYGSSAQTNEGFLDVGGALTEFNGPAGNTNTQALGINSSDVVVGTYDDSGGNTHGFSRSPSTGALTTIDYPGAVATLANGINDAGTVVGFYQDGAGNTHGYSDKGGVFASFDVPGSQLTTIRGINNHGVFVGVYTDSAGNTHGYIDTPPAAPPPVTMHLLWGSTAGVASIWNYSPSAGTYTYHNYGPFAGYAAVALTGGG